MVCLARNAAARIATGSFKSCSEICTLHAGISASVIPVVVLVSGKDAGLRHAIVPGATFDAAILTARLADIDMTTAETNAAVLELDKGADRTAIVMDNSAMIVGLTTTSLAVASMHVDVSSIDGDETSMHVVIRPRLKLQILNERVMSSMRADVTSMHADVTTACMDATNSITVRASKGLAESTMMADETTHPVDIRKQRAYGTTLHESDLTAPMETTDSAAFAANSSMDTMTVRTDATTVHADVASIRTDVTSAGVFRGGVSRFDARTARVDQRTVPAYVFCMSALPLQTACEEKLRLLVEYQRATQEYSARVGAMTVWSLTKRRYEQLAAAADKARHDSQEACANLDRHIEEHGC
jgi:hypothetical protein